MQSPMLLKKDRVVYKRGELLVKKEIKIRKANKEDIPQLLDLMHLYIVDFYKRPEPDTESLQALIADLIDNQTLGLQFVAEKAGELLGFATLYFSMSTLQVKKTAILNDLFVLDTARGQQIGERLFQACLFYIRENDFAYLTWETAKDNVIAQSLYKKMGGQLSEWLTYEIS